MSRGLIQRVVSGHVTGSRAGHFPQFRPSRAIRAMGSFLPAVTGNYEVGC